MKISAYQLAKYCRANDGFLPKSAKIYHFPSIEIEPSQETNELENKLSRFIELKELLGEYSSLRDELKRTFEGMEEVYVGSYKVTGKYIDMPEKLISGYEYWKMNIRKI